MAMRAFHHRYSIEDYVGIELTSRTKHEYFRGEIFAMGGGTPAHSALAVTMTYALARQLEGRPCRVYNSDLRIGAQASGLFTYPDVSVVCGKAEMDPLVRDTIVNPLILVEVLSRSTEDYDRGEKFEYYREISSLKEYVLVSHREPLIEVFHRAESGDWTHTEARAGQSARLESLGCTLDVDEIYAGIDLQPEG